VASAKADGDHNVAIEKCNALAGDAQKACKDQVDAKLRFGERRMPRLALAAQKPQGN